MSLMKKGFVRGRKKKRKLRKRGRIKNREPEWGEKHQIRRLIVSGILVKRN